MRRFCFLSETFGKCLTKQGKPRTKINRGLLTRYFPNKLSVGTKVGCHDRRPYQFAQFEISRPCLFYVRLCKIDKLDIIILLSVSKDVFVSLRDHFLN